jgi:hypothetical protein
MRREVCLNMIHPCLTRLFVFLRFQIFGIAPIYTWCLPVDPIFEDFDRVMGYTMPQRLDRERQFCEMPINGVNNHLYPDLAYAPSTDLPKCVNDLLPV